MSEVTTEERINEFWVQVMHRDYWRTIACYNRFNRGSDANALEYAESVARNEAKIWGAETRVLPVGLNY